ncbi:uncharacterized protein LOC109817124 isoform X3 [Cajanus cajan]|uniref:uncharacterized protein LOC109817124 isoform X3 n=1 Tax=Cajanus cajan TaxID=3821 RepID=UPI0010FB0927|nr:uncharacterized protein LOC109817124 isoform X3 [Cajanus cajan]XP_029131004.1 uncharacterized protein LOC109817124 isoform X3 [Cajanus cajan]
MGVGCNKAMSWMLLLDISRTSQDLILSELNYKPGTPVSPVAPITFLYDPVKSKVILKTSSLTETRDFNINIIAEFTKPVFGTGFGASMIDKHNIHYK